MAKITDLTEKLTPGQSDYLILEDMSAGATKKIKFSSQQLYFNPIKFSVYQSAAWTMGAKVPFDTELLDTGNNFDSTTNHRFVAPVAGFYQVNWMVTIGTSTSGIGYNSQLYKNGSFLRQGNSTVSGYSGTFVQAYGGANLEQLAAGDYLEIYTVGNSNAGGTGAGATYFSGFLVSVT